ncbi:DNA glycosylase AlkZ-like family protein [Streptomyces hypolithicus]
MILTARQLALATLDRQLLLERQRLDVAEAVRRVCALQAQAPASPYLALWNRVQDFVPEDLDAAFADRRIVAILMRITLHAVHAEEVEDAVTGRFGEHAHRVWWALRTYAPVPPLHLDRADPHRRRRAASEARRLPGAAPHRCRVRPRGGPRHLNA